VRLLEAIIEANHRALAGDDKAGLHPSEFEDELPLVALTCIDPRLNPLFPQVLGIPVEKFIWLRNAGNIITGPVSSTMRSLALACALKGGKEIAIIGHTDCQVGKTSTMQLIERLRALGIERNRLPENINEYFGTFASEQQNVIKATDIVRSSPIIGPKIPVHGLMVNTQSGKLEWLVNGYQALETMSTRWNEVVKSAGHTLDALKSLNDFHIGEMKFPDTKIGEAVVKTEDWLAEKVRQLETPPPGKAPSPAAAPVPPTPPAPHAPPKIPLPPPIRPKITVRKVSW
jgi:carbonic anhydrase